MTAALRRLAFGLTVVLGVAAILATSAPPPPRLELDVLPAHACRGDEVTLDWRLVDGATPAPDDLRFATIPADAFDPPLAGARIPASGTRTARVLAPAYVGIEEGDGNLWWVSVGVDAADCDARGLQLPADDLRLVAVRADPNGDDLLGVAPPAAGDGPSRLWRWGTDLQAGVTIEVEGWVSDVAVDAAGRLGVTGRRRPGGPGTAAGAFAAMLTAAGTVVWSDELALPSEPDAPDGGLAVAFAPNGDLLVAGRRSGAAAVEGFVRRYGPDGDLLWDHPLVADDDVVASAIVVADDGRVFVAGETRASLAGGTLTAIPSAFLRAIDPAGARVWTVQRRLVPGEPGVALAAGGRVLLLASDLTAFEADGTEAWRLAGPGDGGFVALAPDGSGGAFVAARRVTTVRFPPSAQERQRDDVLVQRIDASGAVTRSQAFGSLADEATHGLAAWPAAGPGAVAVAGTTRGSLLAVRPDIGLGRDTFLLVLTDD